MRKFWGWLLFLVSLLDSALIWYNLAIAPWRYEVRGDWRLFIYLSVLGLCLFGWCRLVLRNHKEVNNARKR